MGEIPKVTHESFEDEVLNSRTPVVIDFWGPRCVPCIQLDPLIEELSEEFQGRVKIAKVIAPEARKLCIELKVMSLPTFLAFRDGEETHRITGEVSQHAIRDLAETLASGIGRDGDAERIKEGGAKVVGP